MPALQENGIIRLLLTRALPARPFLGLGGLIQEAQLGAVGLQHRLFALNARLQIEDALLILGRADGVDQLLYGGKATARGGVRMLGGDL